MATRRARAGRGESDQLREEIVDWLRDAYAMEKGLERALEKQSKNDDLSSGLRTRVASHLEETRHHAELVRTALASLDADTSGLKTSLGIVAQATKGMGTAFARDERIKDLLDAYSMEHFEIACYTALAAAAERAGFETVANACHRILGDEERMAQTLLKSIPSEVTDYLFETTAAEAA